MIVDLIKQNSKTSEHFNRTGEYAATSFIVFTSRGQLWLRSVLLKRARKLNRVLYKDFDMYQNQLCTVCDEIEVIKFKVRVFKHNSYYSVVSKDFICAMRRCFFRNIEHAHRYYFIQVSETVHRTGVCNCSRSQVVY